MQQEILDKLGKENQARLTNELQNLHQNRDSFENEEDDHQQQPQGMINPELGLADGQRLEDGWTNFTQAKYQQQNHGADAVK